MSVYLCVDAQGVGLVIPHDTACLVVNVANTLEAVNSPSLGQSIIGPAAVFHCKDGTAAMATLAAWRSKGKIAGMNPRKADWGEATYIGGAQHSLAIVN
jgi:hypothetical protein